MSSMKNMDNAEEISDARSHNIKEIAQKVLQIEAQAIIQMSDAIEDEFCEAVKLLVKTKGRVIVSGMGKSGHIARKLVATLASTGTPAQFVHPGEASHGDLGMITSLDTVILMSNSGETKELADIIAHTRRFGIKLIGITKSRKSTLGQQSDIVLELPDAPEACAIGMAPTTSTTCTLALGDALAVSMMKIRGFEKENFLTFHPGGKLGAELVTVQAIMHTGAQVPIVSQSTSMGDALVEMTSKGFGVAAVVDNGQLIGAITDGDLRRNMSGLMEKTAGDVSTLKPRTICPQALAGEALGLMNTHKITAIFVVSDDGVFEGVLQIHDCLRLGVA